MICEGPVRGFATTPEESWSKYSSCLGHVSVQTTERYIGCKQRLKVAVNDQIGIEPALAA
jgi:hypothetical protein